MIFVDTDIMIDILREYPPAIGWLDSVGEEPLLLSGFVTAELIQGCANKQELKKVSSFLSRYRRVWPDPGTCDRALANFSAFHLSRGLGLIDALVAQTAIDLAVPLQTFNAKHYECIPGVQILQPYEKTDGGRERDRNTG